MPTQLATRIAALATTAIVLAACTTAAPPPPPPPGEEAEFCPQVALREGTTVLRRGTPEALEYVASITETTRSCRVIGGQLVIEVGVAGSLVPGVASRPGPVQLPLRVVVTRGDEVLYSNLGRLGATVAQPGVDAQPFRYVDRGIRLAEPASRQVSIQVGFDERN